jgi:hypothetical protein
MSEVQMAHIQCAQKLWRTVRTWPFAASARPHGDASVLCSWAATRFQEGDFDLILAVDSATLLTVVLPLRDSSVFASDFVASVGMALRDLGISCKTSELPAFSAIGLHFLRDPALRTTLSDVEWFCGIETCYHRDLRIIQRNLNDVPHAAGVPAQLIRTFFATRGGSTKPM